MLSWAKSIYLNILSSEMRYFMIVICIILILFFIHCVYV